MSENKFEIIGRIGWMDIKYLENGTAITTIFLGYKKDKDNYDNFPISFINSINSKRKTAEELAEKCKKGDYIRVVGSLSIDKYKPKNSVDGKEIEKIALRGWGFKKVIFDEMNRKYVDMD